MELALKELSRCTARQLRNSKLLSVAMFVVRNLITCVSELASLQKFVNFAKISNNFLLVSFVPADYRRVHIEY